MGLRIVLAVCAGLLAVGAQAAPPVIATMDRSVWPERLETPGLFDVASRAEILAFAHALWLSEQLDEDGLKRRLGLRFINVSSLNMVRNRLWQRLLENYQSAQKSCGEDANFCVLVEDMEQLRQRAEEYKVSGDSFYVAWAQPSSTFHDRYLTELLYLAALFPQTSSEIERYNSDEMSGDQMPDRTFMLNFEGGPSPANGGTDWLADFMRQQKMTATFFVLGKNLEERLQNASASSVQALYKQQCVGLQGWEHRSHSQWVGWQNSVERSQSLVERTLPDNFVPLFRPPYGHRRADSGDFFRANNLRVSLWNIDAKDDNPRLTSEQISDRVLTLMLLWRRGTVVFHDVTNKAQSALPLLLANTWQSELVWDDCRNLYEEPAPEPEPAPEELIEEPAPDAEAAPAEEPAQPASEEPAVAPEVQQEAPAPQPEQSVEEVTKPVPEEQAPRAPVESSGQFPEE
ncbi:MAG: polysaccharide deacetylase [Pseudomonas sp.]|nr:polysaccharide deacetylase [Pseudomonas sp.]